MSEIENMSLHKSLAGFVKIWKTHPATGESTLLVDKQNLILKGGAKIIAHTLGGRAEEKIWGMYIGYCNAEEFSPKQITTDYADPFSSFDEPFGYLREPLTFSPSYMSSANYDENVVLFSTMITSATEVQGAPFTAGESYLYEVALVAAPDVANRNRDIVFSRTNFNKVLYDANYNFTITWGVRILLS